MSVIIAGERSGVGKTTVTLALLAALRQQQEIVQSFKVGPDYIDPMFHRVVTSRVCYNLDPVLTSQTYVQQCFQQHTQDVDYALVEGVMGLFDGVSGAEDWASTAHIARLLQLPVILVLDCSRLSRSVAAIVHGYRSFDPRVRIAGVVLNRVGSDRHLDLLKAALQPLKIPVLGVLRRQAEITIPDRHLGLVPTDELTELNQILDRLAELGKTCFNWTELLPLLKASPLSSSPIPIPDSRFPIPSPLRLAVARDRAFNFYYADNFKLLEQLGAELIFWSPLQDEQLPSDIQGLYFGGGFPEVFAETLSANEPARQAVQSAIAAGMPTYAECGGLMYLAKHVSDLEGTQWDMVGVLPTIAQMQQKLTLGYRRAIALQDSPLIERGTVVWGHEFHRSAVMTAPENPLYTVQGYDPESAHTTEGWQVHNLHASYVHLHWGDRPEIPTRFLQHCLDFATK